MARPPKTSITKDEAEALTAKLQRNEIIRLAATSHKPSRGDACLSFEGRPWLVEPYHCDAPEVVWRKCVQIGISELLIIRALKLAGQGLGVLYMLPTIDLRNRFVKARVNTAIQKSTEYRKIQQASSFETVAKSKMTDAVELKIFGKGPIYFVGSNSPTGVVECAVDYYTVDELDKCDPERVAMGYDRLSSSKLKWCWRVGNPSFDDYGISGAFKKSSQQHWLIKCHGCGKWQCLDWYRNVVREVDHQKYELRDRDWSPNGGRDVYPMCRKCDSALDRFDDGAWVAKVLGHSVVGWTMSQLYSPMTTLQRLVFHDDEGFLAAVGDEYKMQLFANSRLGEPRTPAGTSLSAPILKSCEADYALQQHSRRPTTMGVDVGASKLHVRISDYPTRNGKKHRRLLWAGTVRKFEDLDTLMTNFNTRLAVIDIDPETRSAKQFQATSKHGMKVWLCSLVDPPSRNVGPALKFDEEARIVTAHRTQVIDSMVAEYFNGTVVLPQNWDKIDEGTWEAQMTAPKRLFREHSTPPRYQWDSEGKPDHHFFGDTYDHVANAIIERGYNASLAADPNFSMYATDPEEERELSDAEEMMELLYPERVEEKKKGPAGGGGDDWDL